MTGSNRGRIGSGPKGCAPGQSLAPSLIPSLRKRAMRSASCRRIGSHEGHPPNRQFAHFTNAPARGPNPSTGRRAIPSHDHSQWALSLLRVARGYGRGAATDHETCPHLSDCMTRREFVAPTLAHLRAREEVIRAVLPRLKTPMPQPAPATPSPAPRPTAHSTPAPAGRQAPRSLAILAKSLTSTAKSLK